MRKLFLSVLVALLFQSSFAQTQPRFWDEVQTLKKFDQQYQFPSHPILFVGSSSIRKWDRLQVVFGKYNVINRGIGGAATNDITFYLNDIVFPYQPRQIVLYVGDNDLPDEQCTADSILNRTQKLYRFIRAKLPTVPIVYISIKPSPSREKFLTKAVEANRLIRNFFSQEKNAVFVDIYSLMLKNGKPRPELFVPDQLHMNEEGYKIWEKALKKHLDVHSVDRFRLGQEP